ncbi:MAG: CocE/NonD family hydrolase [Candidatus Poribacteria bacterium]|nr:CocE/NonD family hydrolase [Candidatus Poribacteria bacterium]
MTLEQAAENNTVGIIVETDVPIPMRDGVVLRGNIFRPEAGGRFPGLLLRTPYGKPTDGYERYVRAGYAVVTQDSRGRYASDGDYVPFTVPHTGDAEDGYDSVEWLAQQPYCNGRVGTLGGSYNAWMQWQLARLRPPHLVAMCAYTIPLELTEVDWPGGFKPGRRVKWWMTTIAPDLRRRQELPGPHTPAEARKIWDDIEQGRWLGFMPWLDLPRYLPKGLAEYAEDWLRHPNRKPWKFQDIHSEVEVPNLDFTGWYDHCNGTVAHLARMQKNARTSVARTQTKLVVGPWNHPGLGQRKIGEIDFGSQAELDLHAEIIRWFDHWLKGQDNGLDREKAVRYFVMGAGEWKAADTWPPAGLAESVYYLSGNGNAEQVSGSGLLTPEQSEGAPSNQYTYDPNDPVPTLWTRDLFTVPPDRRLLEYRQDILHYRTPPLSEEVEVVGSPEVVLYASSSAPDTDFFARLVDESPQGPALEVCYGLVRARHRHSLDCEDLLVPHENTEFRIRLGPTAIRFLKGHRIRLEITSSDFPNHDRNHNTGRNDLIDTELVPARQQVFHSADYPSRLLLPIDKAYVPFGFGIAD